VRSDVEIRPTAAIAARDDAAVSSARGHACVLRFLQRALNRPPLTTRRITRHLAVSWLPTPLPSAARGFQLRVVVTVGANGRPRAPGFFDVLGFVSGPAEVSLSAIRAGHPVSSATEHRLLSLLYSRAEARKP
jgi:hypothetical protein